MNGDEGIKKLDCSDDKKNLWNIFKYYTHTIKLHFKSSMFDIIMTVELIDRLTTLLNWWEFVAGKRTIKFWWGR